MTNKYIKMVKARLKTYRDLQAQHRILLKKYLTAGDPYVGISTDYSKVPAGSKVYNVSSRVEDAIVRSDEIIYEVSGAAQELEQLDTAMAPLKPIQKLIIELKYIDDLDWGIVSSRVGYSERQCKRTGQVALLRMAHILYGEKTYNFSADECLREIS